MKKRRLTLKVDVDEAAVVAPMGFWNQLEEHFMLSAEEFPEQSEGWIEAAEHVRDWVERTKDRRGLYEME